MTKTGSVMPLIGPVHVVVSMPSSVLVKVASRLEEAIGWSPIVTSPPDSATGSSTLEAMSAARSPLVLTRPRERLRIRAPVAVTRRIGTRMRTARPSQCLVRRGKCLGVQRGRRNAPARRDRTASTATTARVRPEVREMDPRRDMVTPSWRGLTRPWQRRADRWLRAWPRRGTTRRCAAWRGQSAGRRRPSRQAWRGHR